MNFLELTLSEAQLLLSKNEISFTYKNWKGETWDGLEINKKPFKELKLPLKAGTRVYYDLLKKEVDKNPFGDIAAMLGALEGGLSGDGSGDGNSITVTLGDGSKMTVPCTHEMWKEFDEMSEADKKLIGKQIDHQLKDVAEQVKKNRGTIPGELGQYINSLYEIEVFNNEYKCSMCLYNFPLSLLHVAHCHI